MDCIMTARVLFSINDEIMAMFRSVVPARERSKAIEKFMQEEVERREMERHQRIEQLAKLVETDPAYAEVRVVSESVDAVAGEALA
jgi:flagellar motor component MotA